MSVTALERSFTRSAFERWLAARNEPAWLSAARREAWNAFVDAAWPERRGEEWSRTDIRMFNLDRYSLPATGRAGTELPSTLFSAGLELAGSSAAVDGHPCGARLKARWANRGVLFGSLDHVLCEHGDRLRKYFMTRAFDARQDRFAALHAACWSGGHILYVPRGVVIDEPLHALSAMTDGGSDLGHTLVILEEGAEATLLAETSSFGEEDGGFHCGATEVLLGPSANLRLVSLQDWGSGVWHFAQQKVIVERDASFQWTVAALRCRLSKVNQQVALVGPGANSQVNGVMFTEGRQHLAYHTLQHHIAPYCRSDFLYKAALQDRSRTVWQGMIKVDRGAQKTNGYQRNDNLLLSDRARADSIPGLEIEADDVRCTHGSTSGKVDEELIFYAMSRGFTKREAVRMIVSGFFQQVFDRITIASVRDALAAAIAARVREVE